VQFTTRKSRSKLRPFTRRADAQKLSLLDDSSLLCVDVCDSYGIRLARPCMRDGYQDPKNCWQCRCPDGFAGHYCETVATGVNGQSVACNTVPIMLCLCGLCDVKAAFHDAGIDTDILASMAVCRSGITSGNRACRTCRRENPREDVGVGVGVVECGRIR